MSVQAHQTIVPPSDALGAVWSVLTEVLGSAAAAVLLRRALKRAIADHPKLQDLTIELRDFQYELRIPEPWHASPDPEAFEAVRLLIKVLCEVLERLTGNILVTRIERLAVLQPYRFEKRGS